MGVSSRSTRSALAAGEGALLMQGERMGGFKALYFNTTLGPVWSLAFFDLESAEIKCSLCLDSMHILNLTSYHMYIYIY